MTKRELVAPPVGTIYQLSHMRWPTRLCEDEYWQVERRTEKTVWLRQLVTNTHDQPIPGMVRSDLWLLERRVLPDGYIRVHKGVYVDLYRDIYTPTN